MLWTKIKKEMGCRNDGPEYCEYQEYSAGVSHDPSSARKSDDVIGSIEPFRQGWLYPLPWYPSTHWKGSLISDSASVGDHFLPCSSRIHLSFMRVQWTLGWVRDPQ